MLFYSWIFIQSPFVEDSDVNYCLKYEGTTPTKACNQYTNKTFIYHHRSGEYEYARGSGTTSDTLDHLAT